MNFWKILPIFVVCSYIKEEKSKAQQFVNCFPIALKEQLEFDNPKIMDEAVSKARLCY